MHSEWSHCRIARPTNLVELKIPVIDSEKYQLPPGTPKHSSPQYIRLTGTEFDSDLSFINDDSLTKRNTFRSRRFNVSKQFKSTALEKEFRRYYERNFISLIYIYIIAYFAINVSVYVSQERLYINNTYTKSIVRALRTFICIVSILFLVLFCCKSIRSKQRQTMTLFNIIVSISELLIFVISGVSEHIYSNFMLLMLFIHLFSGMDAISSCIISWFITVAFIIITYIKERDTKWNLFHGCVPYLFLTAICLSVLSICIEYNARNGFCKLVQLRLQKRISKRSLSMLLPPDVAKLLLEGRRIAFKFKYNLNDPNPMYHGVSVMFCEICNFEQLVSRLSPTNLITTLNKIFTKWDDYIQLHKLFKLKTINEVYIAAGGLPYPEIDANDPFHVLRMVFCANDLMYYCNEILNIVESQNIDVIEWNEEQDEDTMNEYEEKQFKPEPSPITLQKSLEIRIGLNIGPIVAGVIGKKLPRYDLFGDTINVAARMKSTCKPSEIQMTEAFYDALPEAFHACTKKKEGVHVKGKGQMTTFLLHYMDRNEPLEIPMIKRVNKHMHFRQMPIIPSETSVDFDEILDPQILCYATKKRVRSISATQAPAPTDIGPSLLEVLSGRIDVDLYSDSNAAFTLCNESDSLLQPNGNDRIYVE